jgi:hypothetical protein
MHCFEVFEFKFIFEFICLWLFKKVKLSPPYSSPFSLFLARFRFEHSSQIPPLPPRLSGLARLAPLAAQPSKAGSPACSPRERRSQATAQLHTQPSSSLCRASAARSRRQAGSTHHPPLPAVPNPARTPRSHAGPI